MTTDKLLKQRGKTHGSFLVNSAVSQALKKLLRGQYNADNIHELLEVIEWFEIGWDKMQDVHHEALDHWCGKTGRVYSGTHTFDDHWDDMSGYMKLPPMFNHGKV